LGSRPGPVPSLDHIVTYDIRDRRWYESLYVIIDTCFSRQQRICNDFLRRANVFLAESLADAFHTSNAINVLHSPPPPKMHFSCKLPIRNQ
jgi:hypothetical protein